MDARQVSVDVDEHTLLHSWKTNPGQLCQKYQTPQAVQKQLAKFR